MIKFTPRYLYIRQFTILFFLVLVAFLQTITAQPPVENKSQLEKERKEIQNDIKELEGVFDKVKGQKKQEVGKLNLLQRKINLQQKYINNINKELRFIDDDIYRSNVEVYRLQRLLDTLKVQYARSVTYAYKNRSTYDFLNFIFSAQDFNDASKRIAYLKRYRDYREQQVATIKATSNLIEKRKGEQIGNKKVKDIALENQTKQANVLLDQKKEKDKIVSSLKSREKELEKQLAAKRKKDRDLKNILDAIVKREIVAARTKATEATKNPKPVSTTTTTPTITVSGSKEKESVIFNSDADLKLNSNFEANKSRLPWPVDEGYVCLHYGPYQIGETRLKGDNSGTTICTANAGVTVKAIFDGEIVAVFNIGDTKGVMIRHGKYFTIYSNLQSASVSKGATVKTGHAIGKLAQDEMEGSGGKLEFVMMIETKKVNPELWLKKR